MNEYCHGTGAKPPPVHADWPPGTRSPRTCAVVAANSPSASYLATGSPSIGGLRPIVDAPGTHILDT